MTPRQPPRPQNHAGRGRLVQVGREMIRVPPEVDQFLAALGRAVSAAVADGLPAQRDAAAFAALVHSLTQTLEGQTEAAFAASTTGQAERAAIACAAGCAFCCRNSVEITIPEAIALAEAITQRSDHAAMRERFAATAAAIQGLSPLRRQAQAIACPLLEAESCSQYPDRPLACRSTYATSAAACRRDLESVSSGGKPQPIKMPATPQVIRTGIVSGIADGLAARRLQADTVELISAVAMILADPSVIDRWLQGERVFKPFPKQ
ncbi:MAG: YkgJ family cysteine cluster protein [Alphaproteobacteria bacterium]|nr:MAG: YkgJ family cysteine cluster protein [Alphaproteobacteria bacterium]